MQIGSHIVGVCSWSLQAADAAGLVSAVGEAGLRHVQLALAPLVSLDPAGRKTYFDTLRAGGITCLSGMAGFAGEDYTTIASIHRTGGFMPDAFWPARRKLAIDCGRLAAEEGMKHLSTHLGFVPQAGEARYALVRDRVADVAEQLWAMGVGLLFETGQENADTLLHLLQDLNQPGIGVNFDPANMLLYGSGDPVAAIGKLGRYIQQVHVKDATVSADPGQEWGDEVPFGQGEVPVLPFLRALQSIDYRGPLVIEREAGRERIADVRIAVETLRKHLPR